MNIVSSLNFSTSVTEISLNNKTTSQLSKLTILLLVFLLQLMMSVEVRHLNVSDIGPDSDLWSWLFHDEKLPTTW